MRKVIPHFANPVIKLSAEITDLLSVFVESSLPPAKLNGPQQGD